MIEIWNSICNLTIRSHGRNQRPQSNNDKRQQELVGSHLNETCFKFHLYAPGRASIGKDSKAWKYTLKQRPLFDSVMCIIA